MYHHSEVYVVVGVIASLASEVGVLCIRSSISSLGPRLILEASQHIEREVHVMSLLTVV